MRPSQIKLATLHAVAHRVIEETGRLVAFTETGFRVGAGAPASRSFLSVTLASPSGDYRRKPLRVVRPLGESRVVIE